MNQERREKAIAWLKEEIRSLERAPELNGCPMTPEWAAQLEIMQTCLEAVQDHFPDTTKMVPLTLEQLREMDGHPVWVHVIDHTVFSDKEDDFDGWGMCRKSWVRIWDSKRADIVHIDYDFENYGKTWLAYAYHPSHIDREAWEPCRMCENPQSLNRFLEMDCRYCPKCGRPLTTSAWAELEKRLMG